MPVNKSNNSNNKHWSLFHNHEISEHVHKIFLTLWAIILVYVVVLLGTMIRNNIEQFNYIGQAERSERTINISAEGKVTATPDIAMTTMGMTANGTSVAEAQERNTRVMNRLISSLKELGIEDDDIQTTNYNIYPRYNYTEEDGRILEGYEVNQNVTVKIRNLDNANRVLALAGEVGANTVSGLSFTIDDREVYRAQARDEALEKVAEKAQALSRTLGVRFVEIVSYDEYEGGGVRPVPFLESRSFDAGFGGAPDIEAGSTDVMMTVNVVFEIR